MFISWAGPVCSYFPGYMTLRTYRLMPTSEVMFKFVYKGGKTKCDKLSYST